MNLYYLTTYGSPTWNRTKKTSLEEMHYIRLIMEPDEESEGFEPPVLLQTIVFKTTSFDRSDNSPYILVRGSRRTRTSELVEK